MAVSLSMGKKSHEVAVLYRSIDTIAEGMSHSGGATAAPRIQTMLDLLLSMAFMAVAIPAQPSQAWHALIVSVVALCGKVGQARWASKVGRLADRMYKCSTWSSGDANDLGMPLLQQAASACAGALITGFSEPHGAMIDVAGESVTMINTIFTNIAVGGETRSRTLL
jgi:hypothetical protein